MATDPPAAKSAMFAAYEPRQGDSPAQPPGDLVIRTATPADANAMAELTMQREGVPRADAMHAVNLRLNAAPEAHLTLVACVGDELIAHAGAGYVRPSRDQRDDRAEGWYLTGIIVSPTHRRRGIGAALTRKRLTWIAQHAAEAYYFANSINRVSIALHEKFGFAEVRRDIEVPRASFTGGGVGILFKAKLRDEERGTGE